MNEFVRVEHLISEYMKRYEMSYSEAIDLMQSDLETARTDEELKADTEEDASH